METHSQLPAYEAPQAELLLVRIEQSFLQNSGNQGTGQDITWLDEEDFDDYFND